MDNVNLDEKEAAAVAQEVQFSFDLAALFLMSKFIGCSCLHWWFYNKFLRRVFQERICALQPEKEKSRCTCDG
jgi:hypothetical protein